jgi:hypothetical protein
MSLNVPTYIYVFFYLKRSTNYSMKAFDPATFVENAT